MGETTLTVEQLAEHWHTYPYYPSSGVTVGSGSILNAREVGGGNIATSSQSGNSQPHTHALSGESGSANSLPPYYTLALIMRIA